MTHSETSRKARTGLLMTALTVALILTPVLTGCGTTAPIDAKAARALIGDDLPGVKGKTTEDQRRINRTMAGLCGAKVYDRATCAFHQKQIALPYPPSFGGNQVAALQKVLDKGDLRARRTSAKVPFATLSSFARPRTSAVLDQLQAHPRSRTHSLRDRNTR